MGQVLKRGFNSTICIKFKKNGNLKAIDKEMTRFSITLKEGANPS